MTSVQAPEPDLRAGDPDRSLGPCTEALGHDRRDASARHRRRNPLRAPAFGSERPARNPDSALASSLGARSQFLRFCLVGGSGYVVNLVVYWALLYTGLHYLAAAAVSFGIAAGNNFVWNRSWTFAARTDRWVGQCLRALLVSVLSLGLNQISLLALVGAGAGHLVAQATAIVLVTPFSFAANRLWAFAGGPEDTAAARELARA